MKEKKGIELQLSDDEALVFFSWLRRFNEKKHQFEDQAEERVLWDIEALLEKSLSEPFLKNFDELLMEARSRVRDSTE